MGCDIHMALEKKVGNKYVLVTRIDSDLTDRHYRFFSSLAGVRGYGERSTKGIPNDISEGGKLFIDEYGSDGHSHSYDSVETVLKCKNQAYKDSFEEWGEEGKPAVIEGWDIYKAFNYYFDDVEDESYSDYRVIYYFDN